MKLTKLVPNIFYSDITVGIKCFVECLGFNIVYDDLKSKDPFCVIERDSVKIHLIQSDEFAKKDRPEIRIETDDIEVVYKLVKKKNPELLHPNAKEVALRPWGAREFALRDESDVCIIFQQSV